MMVPLVITPVTDPDDARLDDYRRLQDHTIRRRLEEAGRFFIVEGWEAVRRLLSSGLEIRSLLVTDDKVDRLDDLGGDSSPVPRYHASRAVVEEVLGFDLHRGVIASAVRPEPRDWRAVATSATRLAVLEGINDHENLGAIFRSAAALGVEGLLLAPTVPDPLYRRSVRVSMGAVLMVPYARIGIVAARPLRTRGNRVHPHRIDSGCHCGSHRFDSDSHPDRTIAGLGVGRAFNGGHGCSQCAGPDRTNRNARFPQCWSCCRYRIPSFRKRSGLMARLRIPALAAILAVAVSVPAAGQTTLAPGGTFLDDDFRDAEPAIEALVAAGITNGCAAELFCPVATVTRGQMATFLGRTLDAGTSDVAAFSDLVAGSYYAGFVNRLFELGRCRRVPRRHIPP